MSIGQVVSFPDIFASKAVKDTPEYGLQVCNAILASTSEHRSLIMKNVSEARKYAEGKQDIKSYLDELEVDGKNMYTNISYRPRPIAQKFIRSVVMGYMLKNEYPEVTSTSKHIQDRKNKRKSDAEFRMDNKDLIEQLTNEVGFPVEDPNEFTPENQEELDLHFSLNDKEREEILMQEMVSFAIQDNDIETIKNQILTEQFITQFGGIYNNIDSNGRLYVDYIQAEDIITDNSFREDFRDAKYKGRFLRMTIYDIRKRFNISPKQEKQLFDCVVKATGKYGNSRQNLYWQEDYRYSNVRPYDNYTVEIAHIWYRTVEVLTTVEGKDRYGRTVFDYGYDIPKEITNRRGREVSTKELEVAYEGFFTADGGVCLEWEKQRNILKAGEDKDVLLSPFIFFMPENSGRMLPNSMMSMMIDSIRTMDITVLKIKQALAKSVPDDWMIDVEGLMDLDLGTGSDLQPLELNKIHQQTGRLYYKGTKEDGITKTNPPMRASNSSLDVKLQGYINIYNTELNWIREYIGVSELRDGSATSPRIGFKFLQAQSQASNTNTWFIYRAYLKMTEELIKQIGIRIWDTLNYSTNINKGYIKYLGKQNVDWIKSRKEITASSYDIKFSLGISEDDKITLEQYIQTCLANGSLQMPDALLINRIEDPVIAERMLTFLYNKRRKENAQEADARSKASADANAQAGVMVEQEKQKTAQLEAQVTLEKEKTRGEQERSKAMEMLAWDLIRKEQEGVPIPPKYQAIVDAVLTNRGLNVVQETTEKEQVMEQEAMAQEQEAVIQQLQQAVQNGEITEEQAMQEAQNMGIT